MRLSLLMPPLVLLLTMAQAVAQTLPAQPQKPTLAVLPFLGNTAAEKTLADRMRFAVSQKLSTDPNALTDSGAYNRMDNVQVDGIYSALQLSATQPLDDNDLQQLLTTLNTDYTIAGTIKGRQLSLTLYKGLTKSKFATVEIPPGTESPKLAVEKVLTDLTGTTFAHIRDVEADHSNPAVEKRFAERPNLVPDPSFDLAAKDPRRVAANWDAILQAALYPPPLITADEAGKLAEDRVAIVPRSATGLQEDIKVPGYCLMLRMSKHISENNGLACESTWIPCDPNKKYRFTVRFHSTGPTLHLFLKGFGDKPDQYSSKDNPDSSRREFYRAQVTPRNKNAGWDLIEMDFTPSTVKPTDPKIQWLRLDLYIYLHPGDVFFDDVTLKKIDE